MSRRLLLTVALSPVVATLAVAAQTDVTGTWNFAVELDVGAGEPTFVFTQEGETLTGTYQSPFGEADVTGTVTDNEIEFRFSTQGGEAVYTGTIDGDMMKGACDYGIVGEGTWEAKQHR